MDEQFENHSCDNHSFTEHQKDTVLIVMSSLGFMSFSACILTICLVFSLKLHRHFLYRLAMYQVASSMLVSLDDILVITLTSYVSGEHSAFHHVMCQLTGFLLTYFIWMKLLFTSSLIVHLFSLAVCLKNLKHLEIGYVLFSALFPLLFAWVPFINDGYGSAGGWCWIKARNSDCSQYKEGIIEQYTLWYGPCYLFLATTIIAAVIVFLVLIFRGCGNNRSLESESLLNQSNRKNRKALIEVLPLLAYPTIFFFFNLFAIAHRTYNALSSKRNYELAITHACVNALWGVLSSLALLIHMLLARYLKKRAWFNSFNIPDQSQPQHTGADNINNYTSYAEVTTYAKSNYSIPGESEIDKCTEENEHSPDRVIFVPSKM